MALLEVRRLENRRYGKTGKSALPMFQRSLLQPWLSVRDLVEMLDWYFRSPRSAREKAGAEAPA